MDDKNSNDLYKPVEIPKIVYKPIDKKDITFMILFLISSFFMVCFGIWGGFKLGFTIAYFILFAVTTAYLFKKVNGYAIACGLMSLAGSVTYLIHSDSFINAIILVLIGGLYVIYALGISDTFNANQSSFKGLFYVFKSATVHPIDSFDDVFGGIKAYANERKKSLAGIVGVLAAIPFVVIIVPLLSKSDVAFESLMKRLGESFGITLLQLAISIPIALFVFTFAYEKRNMINKKDVKRCNKKRGISVSVGTSFLAVISATYVVYLFSQLAYFFSAFKGILPDDYEYTASAFARRGFFEMFAICVINVLIVSVISMISKQKNVAIKLLSCFISLFSVLMIAISMQKMRLNISIYGLSKNRVMVSVFMIMLLVIFAFFILHIFAPKIAYMQPIVIICSAIFIVLSFSNIDAYIAKYNINAYETGKIASLDIESISNLSDSAVPYLVDLTNSNDIEISKQSARYLAKIYNEKYINNDYADDFRCFNIAIKNAVSSFDKVKNNKLYNSINEIASNSEYYYDDETDEFSVETYANDDLLIETYKFDKEQGTYTKK